MGFGKPIFQMGEVGAQLDRKDGARRYQDWPCVGEAWGRGRATPRSPRWRTQEIDVLTQRGSWWWQGILFVSIPQGVGGAV